MKLNFVVNKLVVKVTVHSVDGSEHKLENIFLLKVLANLLTNKVTNNQIKENSEKVVGIVKVNIKLKNDKKKT